MVGISQQCIARYFTSFEPQNVCNILWSFATLNVEDELLFEKAVTECI
jgi:hypothetical protein